MKRVGHLFGAVSDFHALCRAARRAARGKRLTAEGAAFLFDLEPEVLRLQRELTDGTWRTGPYRTFPVVDPKPRTISAAPFRDRVVHHALCAAVEPVFERYAIPDSYACRRGKGLAAALRRAQDFARRWTWFLALDVRKFFETIDHAVLAGLLRRLVKDRAVLDLFDRVVAAGAPGSPAGRGLPIGNLTSQHLANLYLGPLDHLVKERLRVRGYLRYMDDLRFFGPDRASLEALRRAVAANARDVLRLEIKDEATRLLPVADGVPFLGFRIWPRLVRFDAARVRRFRRRLAGVERGLAAGTLDDEAAARRAASLVGWSELAQTRWLRRSTLQRREGTR